MQFDLRDVLKSLKRTPGYTLTIVATLALTIGVTTAVFSIVDGVLLKPLSFRESRQLVSIKEIWNQLAARIGTIEVNEQHFEYWRARTQTFESMAQYIVLPSNLTGVGEPAQVQVGRTSGSLFDVLRVPAALGRTLTPGDEPSSRAEVVVITDACWRQRFGSDPSVVGRTIALDGIARTIVGVLPRDFRLPTERLSSVAEAFVPIHADVSNVGWEGDHNDEAIGRLRSGVTPKQAQAELDVLQRQVGEIATKEAHELVSLSSAVAPLAETITGKSRTGLLVLLAAVAAVLLIACSNLANLSLARSIGRARDTALRSALGASRGRLLWRTLIEQIVLSAVGGGLGVGVAWAALRVFVRTAPISLPRVNDVAIDGRALGFAAAVSMTTAALVALVPVWRTLGGSMERALRSGAVATTGDRGAQRTRNGLLAAQVGLSLTLLVITALLGASFARVMTIDRGFTAEQVLLVPVSLPSTRYQTEAVRQRVYDGMLESMRALPGVTAVSALSLSPLTGSGQVNVIAPDGSPLPRSAQPSANFRFVGTNFFRTMGIAVVRGRAFTEADHVDGRLMPALITPPTAERLFPGEDPIGKHFSRGIPGEGGFEVVGIAADARLTALDRTPPFMVYLPYWWRTRSSTSLLVKTAAEPATMMTAARRAIHAIDPEIAIGDARPLEQLVDASVAARRYQMELFVVFGVVALFIATLGVYSVTAYGVLQRRREMNIRVALGARRAQVVAMILRQAGSPIAIGLAIGVAGALGAGGLVASLLFDVRPRDPIVITLVAAIVAGVGLSACLVAARQGMVTDPAAALRDE